MKTTEIKNEGFQFHKGTIRTNIGFSASLSLANFNSIKVQLEQYINKHYNKRHIYFNSIKVQLEQVRQFSVSAKYLFQFHKGTIRTVLVRQETDNKLYFNSIKVQLELYRANHTPPPRFISIP